MVKRADGEILARKHLDRQLSGLPTKAMTRPPKGWLRAIRDALGLTSRQLAARMGKNHSTITAIEKGEIAGTITLNSLKDAAEALNCTLMYAIVPNEPLDATVRSQARKVAETRLRRVSHTMRLEDQSLRSADYRDQLERLTDDLLRKGGSALWDES